MFNILDIKFRESEGEIGLENSTGFILIRSKPFYMLYMWRYHSNAQWVSMRIFGWKFRFAWGTYPIEFS